MRDRFATPRLERNLVLLMTPVTIEVVAAALMVLAEGGDRLAERPGRIPRVVGAGRGEDLRAAGIA